VLALTEARIGASTSWPVGGASILLVGSALAFFPLLALRQTAADTWRVSRLCQLLANEGAANPSDSTPSLASPEARPRQLLLTAPLGAIVLTASLFLLGRPADAITNGAQANLGFGCLLGALLGFAATTLNQNLAAAGAQGVRNLLQAAALEPASPPPLALGLDAAARAGDEQKWRWPALAAAPALLLAIARALAGTAAAQELTTGCLVGLVVSATFVAVHLEASREGRSRPHAMLALPTALTALTLSFFLFTTLAR
jgi:hypothetical protein